MGLGKRFDRSWGGFRFAYCEDVSVRRQIWLGLLFILAMWLSWPLTLIEAIVFVLAYMVMVAIELINTAFETALDRLHPRYNSAIGKAKDVASSAVGVSILFSAIVLISFLVRNAIRLLQSS